MISIDLSSLEKDGARGNHEVVVFYHAGKGTSGDNSEDKKFLSENLIPLMIQVSLSSSLLGTMATTLGFLILIFIY